MRVRGRQRERGEGRERERRCVLCIAVIVEGAFQRVPAARSALHGTLDNALVVLSCNSSALQTPNLCIQILQITKFHSSESIVMR